MQIISQRAHGPAFAIKAVKQHAVWLQEKRKRELRLLALMNDKPQGEKSLSFLVLACRKTDCTAADAPHSLHVKPITNTQGSNLATGFTAISDMPASL